MMCVISVTHCQHCSKPMHYVPEDNTSYRQLFIEPVNSSCAQCYLNSFEPESLEADPLSNGYYLYTSEQECSIYGESNDV